jgi:hypothetical protein
MVDTCQRVAKRAVRGFTLIEIVVVLLLVVSLILLATCEPDPLTCSAPFPYSVEILPPSVRTDAGTRVSFEARILTEFGNVILVGKYPSLAIQWSSASAPGLFLTSSTPQAIAQAPGSSISDITATVTCDSGESVASAPASLNVAPNLVEGTSDWVKLPHVPDRRPAMVLIDSGDGGSCDVEDWTLAIARTGFLERNLDDGVCAAQELFLLQEGAEMIYDDAPFWTAVSEGRAPATLPVLGWTADPSSAPNSFRYVPVVIGLPKLDAMNQGIAEDELELADGLMDRNRVGIGLRNAGTFAHGYVDDLDPVLGCGAGFLDTKMLPNSGNNMSDELLFVLFVERLTTGSRGTVCTAVAGQDARVIYLAWSSRVTSTITHEFGHAMGLAPPLFNGGHVNSIGAFERDNIMWGATDLELATARTRLTIGQVYRMNLHSGSWINLSTGGGKACQTGATIKTGPCPPTDKSVGN